ncbi:hypothetical protein ZIOFF_017797 [Zingiber officinale]|uniref:Uncharacterized protein n=1 Tax=Zingiber officinale TaxID=94328 RepID=A0A8J5LAH0_ZINOF|nr:hypothetical protein ZIOFF_017797 [Zingiber officinale]
MIFECPQVYFGTRFSTVIGSSYTYLLPTISMILSKPYVYFIDPYERFVHTMRSIQGTYIATYCFQITVRFSGVWRIFLRFLSPLFCVSNCIEIGLPTIILLVIFVLYLPNAMS